MLAVSLLLPLSNRNGNCIVMYRTSICAGFEPFAVTEYSIVGSSAQTFEWKRCGLKLHVPEGALPEEEGCRIEIKACMSGQFEFPVDSELVSYIYWLSCPRKFLKPVTLEIQHCASIQDVSQYSSLQFVIAKCSQPELPYKFRALDRGAFSPHSSFGSIEISQFSLVGLISSRLRRRRYYSALYSSRIGAKRWQVDIVVTWNLPAHLKVGYNYGDCMS